MVRVTKDWFPKPKPDEDRIARRIFFGLCAVVIIAPIAYGLICWSRQTPLRHQAAPAEITLPGSAEGP
jgi:hypothetical protein